MPADFDASIVDQHVRGLAERLGPQLERAVGKRLDETMARSIAFVVLCVKLRFDLSEEEALDCLTEGGNDFGVDAMLVEDVGKNETLVALFQGKYHHKLEVASAFPQSGVEKAVQAVRMLLDPEIALTLNPRLQAKVAEVRARVREGGRVPRVVVHLCSNGRGWEAPVQQIIEGNRFGEQARFEHLGHAALVKRMITPPPIDDVLQLVGKSIVADTHGMRALEGMLPAVELARLMDAHGDHLLQRNIRRYLGVSGCQVNKEICATLADPERRKRFHFFNNGLTLICSRFVYNTLQSENHKVRVEGLQIINGGQTSRAIQEVLAAHRTSHTTSSLDWNQTQVKVAMYEVSAGLTDQLVWEITKATNYQTPVDLIDLNSNDEGQRKMQCSIELLGYRYHRQRSEGISGEEDIDAATAVKAVVAVWQDRPYEAGRGLSGLFDQMCDEVFNSHINGAQLVLATLLLRAAKDRCMEPAEGAPLLVRYATNWAAMLMGWKLLEELGTELEGLDHRTFARAREHIFQHGDRLFEGAVQRLEGAAEKVSGGRFLGATDLVSLFRRKELLEVL